MSSVSIEASKRLQSQIAMVILLVSWSMLFATLFMGYALIRFSSPIWPPMGMQNISLGLPILSTLLILVSSFFLEAYKKSRRSRGLYAAVALGVCFMLSQWAIWTAMKAKGLFAHTGIYPSILYGFTWIHAAHVVLGLFGLVWLCLKQPREAQSTLATNVIQFWHFLALVWIMMFIVLFVF